MVKNDSESYESILCSSSICQFCHRRPGGGVLESWLPCATTKAASAKRPSFICMKCIWFGRCVDGSINEFECA